MQHGQHDLGLVAVIRDGSARDGTKFRQTNLRWMQIPFSDSHALENSYKR